MAEAHQHNIVALIPARAGSKRIIGKNIRPLAGHPLLAYTIVAAKESGIFDGIIVSTDSADYGELAASYSAIWTERSPNYATDNSPDFEWVWDCFSGRLRLAPDAFAILRPTSPFRTADTIRRAWAEFQEKGDRFDSLRAVDQKPKQHPWKMWLPAGEGMIPLFPDRTGIHPSHSVPTQLLRQVWPQNASLEIAWTKTLALYRSISGERVLPFFTEGYEGYDLNTEDDWQYAEWLVAMGKVVLPDLDGGNKVVVRYNSGMTISVSTSVPGGSSPQKRGRPGIPSPDTNPSSEITEGLRLPQRGRPKKQ